MHRKLGDLATVIDHALDSSPMPLDSTSVDDHLIAASFEAMADLKLISEALLKGGDRENAMRLQNARMTMKSIAELYTSLKDKDALERRHRDRS